MAPHPERAVACDLVRGGVGTMAHFSGMTGRAVAGVREADRAVFEGLHSSYDREHHTQARARHAAALDREFIERFAVVGPPRECVRRLLELGDAGVGRLIVTGASLDADRDEAARSRRLFTEEVLPAVQAA